MLTLAQNVLSVDYPNDDSKAPLLVYIHASLERGLEFEKLNGPKSGHQTLS